MNTPAIFMGPPRTQQEPCSRCDAADLPWDAINDLLYCPPCFETIMMGMADRIRIPAVHARCAVCDVLDPQEGQSDARKKTARFRTVLLRTGRELNMDVCDDHLRKLLARNLDTKEFMALRALLDDINLSVQDVFLLHAPFYDYKGWPLQPIEEEWKPSRENQ